MNFTAVNVRMALSAQAIYSFACVDELIDKNVAIYLSVVIFNKKSYSRVSWVTH